MGKNEHASKNPRPGRSTQLGTSEPVGQSLDQFRLNTKLSCQIPDGARRCGIFLLVPHSFGIGDGIIESLETFVLLFIRGASGRCGRADGGAARGLPVDEVIVVVVVSFVFDIGVGIVSRLFRGRARVGLRVQEFR